MQNPNSAMTHAFDGMVKEIAIDLGITDKRLYELLGRDNPYPKLWRLLTPLGRMDYLRLLIVQADFNARVARLAPKDLNTTVSSTHKELTDAMQVILDRAPKSERKREILEAIAELNVQLAKCD